MLRWLLEKVENLVLRRPRPILVAALVGSLLAIWAGSSIELRTSRRELVPVGDPAQARWDALHEEFGAPDPLIVVLHGAAGAEVPTEVLEATAGRVADRLRGAPAIGSVFARVDPDWALDVALFTLPPHTVESITRQLQDVLGDEGTAELADFSWLNGHLADRLELALASGSVLPDQGDVQEARRIVDLLGWQRRFFDDPEPMLTELQGVPFGLAADDGGSSLSPAGYLATHDVGALLILVTPAGEQGGVEVERRLVATARSVVEAETARLPDLRYGLTGPPALIVEEMDSLGRDGRNTSALALFGVGLLALAAFHHRRHAFIGLGMLVAGVLWALAGVWLRFGYLNLITTAMVPILVGLGIDFAVHPISQFELERRASTTLADAVRATFSKTSAAVCASALTTAAAFFCFLLMEFRGFSELGVVAGIGVLLCLLAALLVLPAGLLVFGRAPSRDPEPAAFIDRIWGAGLAARLCARPRTTLAGALVLTTAAGLAARHVKVNSSLLELQPPGSDALAYLDFVDEHSSLAAYFNLVVADDLAEMRRQAERAAAPSIANFESALRFLPADPAASERAAVRVAGLLDRVRIVDRPLSPDGLGRTLERLEAALEEAADNAFVTGRGALAGLLEEARSESEATRLMVAAASPDRLATWEAGLQRLRARTREIVVRLRSAARHRAPTLETLPPELRERFVTDRGRLVGYLHPAGDVFDPAFADEFNAASLVVSPAAIGFPMMFAIQSRQITSGFALALTIAALLVIAILGASFRRPSHVALALVPVAIGIAWMLGLMRLLALDFNLANLVAVPLVLGVGIDAGVHVIHRYRLEGDHGITLVLEHTGRAILIASLTTMVGFGALSIAAHRGMASLGTLLFLGVGSCMIAALLVLPNILVLTGMARR